MRNLAILLLAVLSLQGCSLFRRDPIIMYRDGWGGTNVAVPPTAYNQPIPYGAAMPPVNSTPPKNLESGWYLGDDHQWRKQRWVLLGFDDVGNPSYQATYP